MAENADFELPDFLYLWPIAHNSFKEELASGFWNRSEILYQ